jgi:hypothetical protein
MSCYGWERGEVKLPIKAWKEFKTQLIARLQVRQNELLRSAETLYTKIKEQKPKNKLEFITQTLSSDHRSSLFSHHEVRLIKSSLLKENRLIKPKTSLFKIKKNEINFSNDDLDVNLNDKTKTVRYDTDDNNHSIDRARETHLGKVILGCLNNVSYSSKTGGYLEQQTEYDVNNGTGARVTDRFGSYANMVRSNRNWTSFR